MNEETLKSRLAAVTTQDFEELIVHLDLQSEDFKNKCYEICSPGALSAYLVYRENCSIEFFHNCCSYYCNTNRIDLLECFVPYVDFSMFFQQGTLFNNNSFLHRFVMEAYIDLAIFFLDHGLDPNETYYGDEVTILSGACIYGKVDLVDLLLARGADPNKRFSYFDKTAVFAAVNCSDIRVLDRLILYGADLTVRNNENKSLLDHAVDNCRSHSVRRLIEMRVEVDRELLVQAITLYQRFLDQSPDAQEIIDLLRAAGCREPTKADFYNWNKIEALLNKR